MGCRWAPGPQEQWTPRRVGALPHGTLRPLVASPRLVGEEELQPVPGQGHGAWGQGGRAGAGRPQCAALPTALTRDGWEPCPPVSRSEPESGRCVTPSGTGQEVCLGPPLPVSGAGSGEQPWFRGVKSLCLANLGCWSLTAMQSLCVGGTKDCTPLQSAWVSGVRSLPCGAAGVCVCACASSLASPILFVVIDPSVKWDGPWLGRPVVGPGLRPFLTRWRCGHPSHS